ncbi:MAG: cyclase family protein [Cytophagales bacterium]|nr:MAG: cyclase family protein [Cytophagales bacterium]TAF59205.1 MAG: cyclase family protein [Cytophagales bacterium]
MLSFSPLQCHIDGKLYTLDLQRPIDISLPLSTAENQVNCYYAEAVQIEAIRVGSFVGDVREGGSCNYVRVSLTPHGNGTHTECYGHISSDGHSINSALRKFWFLAYLVSVEVSTSPNGDRYVSLETLQKSLKDVPSTEALVIRTLPNPESKKHQQYSGTNPTFLEPQSGDFLRQRGVEHLLIDTPSVDKEWDEGALNVHKGFWQFPSLPRAEATITELVYVPNHVKDGLYALNLQIISLESDASPSKPVLYALKSES